MMLCVIDVAAGRRRLYIKAVCQSVREATTASAWIMPASPTGGRFTLAGLFHPQERLITMQKQLEGTRDILMSSADRVAHIDGAALMLL